MTANSVTTEVEKPTTRLANEADHKGVFGVVLPSEALNMAFWQRHCHKNLRFYLCWQLRNMLREVPKVRSGVSRSSSGSSSRV